MRKFLKYKKNLILISSILLFVLHSVFWVMYLKGAIVLFFQESPPWDAGFYANIAKDGYWGVAWAFFPLYPFTLRVFAMVTGLTDKMHLAGVIYSALLFFGFALFVLKNFGKKLPAWLIPSSITVWLVFLLSPGSFIFHTVHTESLFLILSFFAFYLANKNSWVFASIFAGLCAVTRIQGIVVAVCIALMIASGFKFNKKRILYFILSGIISGSFFISYLIYQKITSGDFFKFLHAQSGWDNASSISEIIKTLWFGNEWQFINLTSILHHLYFFILLIGGVLVYRQRKIVGIYVFMSLLVIFVQGHLMNSYRYGAVLFPALFLLGDRLQKLPKILQFIVIALMLLLNLIVNLRYVKIDWAY